MNDTVEYVYFLETPEGYLRHGWSGNGRKRLDQHSLNGFQFVAARPASHADHEVVKKQLYDFRVPGRGKETFRGDEPWEYVYRLTAAGLVVQDFDDVAQMDRLPVEMWSPEATLKFMEANGQQSLLEEVPVRERIVFASEFAHLNSKSDEWFTPKSIIEAARSAMGGIDCDPASCWEAQTFIGAAVYYSKATDGMRADAPWNGRTWLNPPYGRGDRSAGAFIGRLIEELRTGSVTQAITCLNLNSMSTLWFRGVWDNASIHCIHHGRPDFWGPSATGTSPSKGIVLSYFGTNTEDFRSSFHDKGYLIQLAGGTP